MRTKKPLFAALVTLVLAGCFGPTGTVVGGENRPRVLVNRDRDGLAVQGYDVVAYFTDGKPVKGDSRWRTAWNGAVYQFASAGHKATFEADPSRYEPQFGGYCAYAASIDKVSPIDPQFWEIQDGRLILQHNQRAWDLWHADAAGNLVKADANWPGLVARNGTAEKILVNTDSAGVAVQGYDVVAYFTDGKPLPGKPEHESVFGGACYRFASKEHRDAFEREPARYAPQFGGYCAYAASINKVSPIDPRFWQITDGRLLLQHTQKAYDLFNQDTAASLSKADRNWPGLVERNGG